MANYTFKSQPEQYPYDCSKGIVRISDDSKYIAIGGEDYILRFWSMETNSVIKEIKEHTNIIHAIEFSDNGQLIATGSRDKTIRIWQLNNLDGLPIIMTGHASLIQRIKFIDNDTKLVSVSHDSTVIVWNIENAEQIHKFKHISDVYGLEYDQHILYTSSKDCSICLWDLDQGKRIKQWTSHKITYGLKLLYKNQLICLSYGKIIFRDSRSGVVFRKLIGHESAFIWNIYVSLDKSQIATIGGDHQIRFWDLKTNRNYESIVLPSDYNLGVGMNKDWSIIINQAERKVHIWQLE